MDQSITTKFPKNWLAVLATDGENSGNASEELLKKSSDRIQRVEALPCCDEIPTGELLRNSTITPSDKSTFKLHSPLPKNVSFEGSQ
ncbi:hypothetical protein I4U23_014897 [Adineta vaga]|nr:hypothetical protein I4U23_014897 [Adineta vaga]